MVKKPEQEHQCQHWIHRNSTYDSNNRPKLAKYESCQNPANYKITSNVGICYVCAKHKDEFIKTMTSVGFVVEKVERI